MHHKEVVDINAAYPFLPLVLSMIENGESIDSSNAFYSTYLIARQRGYVGRDSVGEVHVSDRGTEFLERRRNLSKQED
jgi:hypothetical protein